MKRWESSELSNQTVDDKPSLVQKKLAPLNEGGPVQLLKVQVIKSYSQFPSVIGWKKNVPAMIIKQQFGFAIRTA